MKTKLTLSIESEIVEKAKKIGLNISQFCENALKIGIEALETANQKIAHNQTANKEGGSAETPSGFSQWTGRDLNPRPPECKSGVHTS